MAAKKVKATKLNSSVRFDKKLAIILAIALIVTVGYFFVRMSFAAMGVTSTSSGARKPSTNVGSGIGGNGPVRITTGRPTGGSY